jgi:hypothetical protein
MFPSLTFLLLANSGRMEDLADMRREEEEKRRKKLKMKQR